MNIYAPCLKFKRHKKEEGTAVENRCMDSHKNGWCLSDLQPLQPLCDPNKRVKNGGFCFLTGTARSVETNTCSTVGRIKGIWFGIFWKEIAATHAVFGQSAELKRPPLWQTKWPVVKKNSKKQTNKQNRDVVTLKLVQLTHDAAETKIAVSPSHSNNVLRTVRGFCSWKPRSDSDLQHRGQLRALTPGCLSVCRTAAAENTVKITPGGSTGHIRSKKTDQRSLIPLILSNKAITDCTEASIPQFLLVPLYWIHPCKQSRTECQQRLSEKKQNIKKPQNPNMWGEQ